MPKQPPIICLMGATASGKTRLALQLVEQLPCAIISVDSAMVYRGMDIGTAKPTLAEQQQAPHRLIDICDPAERYSAGQFCHDALREIEQIIQQGQIPLLVGGTMLYFRSLLQGIAALPTANAEIRRQLNKEAAALGWPALHQRLQAIDPIAAARIHENDAQRIQRALEIHQITSRSLTEIIKQSETISFPYPVIAIGLMPSQRELLYQRIAVRFEKMLQQGFIAEVERFYRRGDLHADLPAIRAVGYRQAWSYLAGLMDYSSMQLQAIAATRQLAKRQLTWLRSWPNLIQIDSESNHQLDNVLAIIAKADKK